MGNKKNYHSIFNTMILLVALSGGQAAFAASAYGPSTKNPCKDVSDNIKTWFPHKDTPEPDSENFASGSICSFNAWSWQMFLWLTQKVKGQPRFLSFETPYTVLNIESREVLKPSSGHSPFDETVQAGPDGILVDQNNNVVYYSQYLNSTFVDFLNDNNLTDPQAVQNFDPNTPFPVGSLELKASWRIVEPGEDTRDVFTTIHEIYGLKKQGAKFVIDTSNIRKERLALVGFHIGGVVKDHPEMIWSTFEHINNSPVVPADFTSDTVIASSGDFTFFNPNPGKSTPQLTNTYAGCNKNYIASPYMTLDKKTQKMSPITQVCLQYKYGNTANYDLSPTKSINESIRKNIAINDAGLKELNAIVKSNLSEEKDVWANYREIGSIWFRAKNALKPDMSLATDFDEKGNQLLIGSMMLSNSTIETYTQFASTENNCFRCHNTEQRLLQSSSGKPLKPLKPMNLNISHAFVNIYTWSQEMALDNK